MKMKNQVKQKFEAGKAKLRSWKEKFQPSEEEKAPQGADSVYDEWAEEINLGSHKEHLRAAVLARLAQERPQLYHRPPNAVERLIIALATRFVLIQLALIAKASAGVTEDPLGELRDWAIRSGKRLVLTALRIADDLVNRVGKQH